MESQQSLVISELVQKFIDRASLLADADNDNKITLNDLRTVLDVNGDGEINAEDIQDAILKINTLFDKISSSLFEQQLKEKEVEVPADSGPVFIDDEAGVVAGLAVDNVENVKECPDCKYYEEIKKNYDHLYDIEAQTEVATPVEKEKKTKKVKRFLGDCGKACIQKFKPRDKSKDKRIDYHIRPHLMPFGPL